jgi:hypothetical protein
MQEPPYSHAQNLADFHDRAWIPDLSSLRDWVIVPETVSDCLPVLISTYILRCLNVSSHRDMHTQRIGST